MFEVKNNGNNSEFSKYLDEKIKHLAITNFNEKQYLTFQKEVLCTLNAIEASLDKIETYLNTVSRDQKFNPIIMMAKIYSLYMLSEDDSRNFKNIINWLIERMDNCRYDVEGKTYYSSDKYREIIKGVNIRIEQLKDMFVHVSTEKSSLLSIVLPDGEKDNTHKSLENKYLLYRNLVNLTSEFSTSSTVFTIPSSPDFLAKFYNCYQKMEADDNLSYHRAENEEVNLLKGKVSNGAKVTKYLSDLHSVFAKIRGNLKDYEKISKRFNSEGYKNLYVLAESHIESFIQRMPNQKGGFVDNYKKVIKKRRYKDFKNFVDHTCCKIHSLYQRHLDELYEILDANLAHLSTSLRFVDNISRYKLPFMDEDQLDTIVEDARLLDLFFQAYREVPGISLTDEELIKLIKDNEESIRNFAKGLIEFIDDYFEQEQELDNDSLITTYYDCVENNHELTEQEVIDHVIQRILAAPQKS